MAEAQKKTQKAPMTIAVSPCALFNLVNKGLDYQALKPGPAFPLIKAVMKVNTELRKKKKTPIHLVLMIPLEMTLDMLTNSITYHQLKAMETKNTKSLIDDLKAMKNVLYLSTNMQHVRSCIKEKIGAATMFMSDKEMDLSTTQLRVAFDGDGVIFSDESEEHTVNSLEEFFKNEEKNEQQALTEGPLKFFFEVLVNLQRSFKEKSPICTFLVTSRGANPLSPANRVLNTLKSWNLEIDEIYFLGGAPKTPALLAIKPHIFFDDQLNHLHTANKEGVITAHVPYGVKNADQ